MQIVQRWLVKAGVALVALAAWHGVARAVDLTSYTAKDEEKKLTLTFTFSAKVQADVISNFQGNFVALAVGELKFTKQQLAGDQLPAAEATVPFYRCVRFVTGEHAGQIRVQLGKLATPADALVVPLDNRIDVEITKPVWKLKPSETKPEEKPAPPANGGPGFVPDETPPAPPAEELQPPAEVTPPAESETPPAAPEETPAAPETPPSTEQAPGSLRDGSSPPPATAPPSAPAEPPAEEQPPAAPEESGQAAPDEGAAGAPEATAQSPGTTGGEVYGQTSVSELPQGAPEETPPSTPPRRPLRPATPPPTPTEQPEAEPTPPALSAPSETSPPPGMPSRTHPPYTEFDLDQVQISGIEVRDLPFNQAIMKLVAASGFNVVVGEGLDTTETTLSFRQRDISLKGALDLLCIAYDLVYTVEPDAIIIKRK